VQAQNHHDLACCQAVRDFPWLPEHRRSTRHWNLPVSFQSWLCSCRLPWHGGKASLEQSDLPPIPRASVRSSSRQANSPQSVGNHAQIVAPARCHGRGSCGAAPDVPILPRPTADRIARVWTTVRVLRATMRPDQRAGRFARQCFGPPARSCEAGNFRVTVSELPSDATFNLFTDLILAPDAMGTDVFLSSQPFSKIW